eukprot:2532798-Pleurochrysis_carterae.AAC.1
MKGSVPRCRRTANHEAFARPSRAHLEHDVDRTRITSAQGAAFRQRANSIFLSAFVRDNGYTYPVRRQGIIAILLKLIPPSFIITPELPDTTGEPEQLQQTASVI